MENPSSTNRTQAKPSFTQQMDHIRYGKSQQTKIASDHDILMKEQTAAEGNSTVQDNNLPKKK
jgi:hypothetical protein